MYKKIIIFIFLAIASFAVSAFNFVQAEAYLNNSDEINELYKKEYESSKIDDLWDKLPSEVQSELEQIGVKNDDITSVKDVKVQNVFSSLLTSFKKSAKRPMKTFANVLAIIILCSLAQGLKLSFEDNSTKKLMSICCVLCIVLSLVKPVSETIAYVSDVIQATSTFMLSYIPVCATLMLAAGQSFSAASFNLIMLAALEIISQLSSTVIVPLINAFFAIVIVASISPTIKLHSLADMFASVSKWLLGIVTTVFVALLSIQNIVASAADSVGNRATKFVFSSFVPVVGGTLSEAISSIQSCIKLLKSGVGAFVIIAIAVMFVPAFVQCAVWMLSINLSKYISEILDMQLLSKLLSSISKVISILLAVSISCIAIFIVSTFIILVIGGNIST